ncbi:hypothetical protein HK101_004955 [Irineochytrium annulatum]|nr:hypothetical protein HK101_004955 [Irineochytrium annulatum]
MAPTPLETFAQERIMMFLGLPPADAMGMVSNLMTLQREEASDLLTGVLGDDPDVKDFVAEFLRRRYPAAGRAPAGNGNQSGRNAGGGRASGSGAGSASSSPKSTAKAPQWKDERNVYMKPAVEESYYVAGKKKAPTEAKGALQMPATPPAQQHDPVPELAKIPLQPVDKDKRKVAKKERQATKKSGLGTVADIDNAVKVGNMAGLNGRLYCECLAIQQINLIQGNKRKAAVKEAIIELSSKSAPKPVDAYAGSRYGQAAGAQPRSVAAAVGAPGKINENAYPTLLSDRDKATLERAQAQKERLLEYQRNSTARTRVHDTASDFDLRNDAANKWLTGEERAHALKMAQEQERMQEEQRKRRVISLDLVNRKVVAVNPKDAEPMPVLKQPVPEWGSGGGADERGVNMSAGSSSSGMERPEPTAGSTGLFHNPTLRVAPKFVAGKSAAAEAKPKKLTLRMKKQLARVEAESPKNAVEEVPKVEDGLTAKERRAAKRETKQRFV